ncbi:S8 family serine peptidase [Kribbella sp. NPDC056345]|uniref:S8 family peptidase n=1 Tax=Kribbella sp. NPDC056345 TaxID=3345789 RepID=UPI0035DF46C2
MQSTARSMRAGLAAAASIAVLAFGLPAVAVPTPAPPKPALEPAPKQPHQVTLITGDRVTLRDGDHDQASVQAGPGRSHLTFNTYRTKNGLYVVPSDVQPELASGRLDSRLFDVNGLIAAGYDDKASKSTPVIVTYAGKAQKRSTLPGAKVTRQLPIVNGAAAAVPKSGNFVAGLRSAGVEKVWLDGKRKPSLDVSVPRIGAPAAWQAGYTGQGIKVAVLDTGIDASHPDLATQVAGAKNFTAEAAGDAVGHGTHVASTIAGTGAASSGKYKGVAPDAQLYDGKVCVRSGCPDSAILAGMEWAATEVKANVVNVSLGGEDTPGTDPLEAAVNRLTAETGTLFVIAAGNSGPTDRTVQSPGSADAALTVGAVDKWNDWLSEFSSRGPRVGDGAVKPDLMAPGEDIVAARAKDAIIGIPVGDRYLSLSGTSMATPHTAGAAALLVQQHPTWKAGELKSALMGSAKPAAEQTAFQQGAGRVDVAAAIKQTVVSDPGNLSFGTAPWPHDDDQPVTKELTYRNLGEQPVTLNLAAELKAPDGSPAPADALSLSASTVTVPAGGTASVQATSNTKHSGPDGFYSGRVTATADGVSVTTAIGVDRESERYTLTLRGIGPDGKPAAPRGLIYSVADDQLIFYGTGQPEVRLRLNKGEQILDNRLTAPNPDNPAKSSNYWTAQPSLQLTKDTTVVIDARQAKQIKIAVPNPEASLAVALMGFVRAMPGVEFAAITQLPDLDSFYSLHLGPELPGAELTSMITTQWARQNSAGQFDNSPYLYAQAHHANGRFPTGFVRTLKAKDLAVLKQQVNAASNRPTWRAVTARIPGIYVTWATALRYDRPSTTTVMVEAEHAKWGTNVIEPIDPGEDPTDLPSGWYTWIDSPDRVYQAGRTYRERFNAAVLGTAPGGPFRYDSGLYLFVEGVLDADGNRGNTLADTESSTLYRDGKQVAGSPWFGYVTTHDLPPEKAQYTFETTQTRESVSGLSTRTDLRWTFSSAATTEETPIPMLGVGYRPKVDIHNVADRTPVTVLPVFLVAGRRFGEDLPLPAIRSVEVEVSGDDGKTWQQASVTGAGRGEYKAVFATPKGAGTVSLRTKAVDAAGNVTEQTTIDAYRIR